MQDLTLYLPKPYQDPRAGIRRQPNTALALRAGDRPGARREASAPVGARSHAHDRHDAASQHADRDNDRLSVHCEPNGTLRHYHGGHAYYACIARHEDVLASLSVDF